MIYKVDSVQVSKAMASSSLKKTKSLSSFGVQIETSVESAASHELIKTTSASALAALQDLLNLQEVAEENSVEQRSPERGSKILRELENLQRALLRGDLDKSTFDHLKTMLNQKTIAASNPDLNDLIQEIEQRLAVEMAKIKQYSSLV